jgi:hypothetical protein
LRFLIMVSVDALALHPPYIPVILLMVWVRFQNVSRQLPRFRVPRSGAGSCVCESDEGRRCDYTLARVRYLPLPEAALPSFDLFDKTLLALEVRIG